jgi:hypothetical protein
MIERLEEIEKKSEFTTTYIEHNHETKKLNMMSVRPVSVA